MRIPLESKLVAMQHAIHQTELCVTDVFYFILT